MNMLAFVYAVAFWIVSGDDCTPGPDCAECGAYLLPDGQHYTNCTIEISEWRGADPTADPYNCSAGPPYNVTEAAAPCDGNDTSCSRVRRNMYDVTADNDMLHVALKALYCAQWWANKYPSSGDPTSYLENQWIYVSSFHGEPGWFTPCQSGGSDLASRGIEAPGCCSHSNPNFVTYHRLLMVQYENALRRWDLRFALPYWDWIYDLTAHSTKKLPPLLSEQTIRDPILNVNISNPYFNFNSTNSAMNPYIEKNYPGKGSCDYVCHNPNERLFEALDAGPSDDDGFFESVILSMMTENLVLFDYRFEIPHNMIHNWIGGNMPINWFVGPDPIFTFHHSQVERLFIIWQKVMEHRKVYYTKKRTWLRFLGCFATEHGFHMTHDPVPPFVVDGDDPYMYNADPITSMYGNSSFIAMNYEDMDYEYDSYDMHGLTIADISERIDKHKRSEHVSLAWYFRYLPEAYTVDYTVYALDDDENNRSALASGSFSTLKGVADSWTHRDFPRYLHKIDITRQLNESGVDVADFEDFYVDVQYDIRSAAGYTANDTGVYHPFVVHHKADGTETVNIYMSDNSSDPRYRYSDMKVFLHDELNSTEIGDNHQVKLVFVNEMPDDLAVRISYFYRYDRDQEFHSFSHTDSAPPGDAEPTILEMSYTRFTDSENLKFQNYYNFTHSTFSEWDGSNQLYLHGKNVIANSDGSVSMDLHPTLSSYFKTDFFEMLSPGSLLNLTDYVVMPWAKALIDINIYDREYKMDSLSRIDFLSCRQTRGSRCPPDSDLLCQVKTADDYNNCVTTDAFQCGVMYGNLCEYTMGDDRAHFYFISQDPTLCQKGLKVQFSVDPESLPTCSCDPCGFTHAVTASIPRTIGDETYWLNHTIGTDCIAHFNLSMPSDWGWMGWALFVPNDDKMYGFAAIGIQCTNNALWYSLDGPGLHSLANTMTGCTHKDVGGVLSFENCHFTFCNDSLRYWPYRDEGIQIGTEYLFRWKGYNGSDHGFQSVHTVGGQAKYTYSDPDADSLDEDSEVDDSSDVAEMRLIVIIVLVVVVIVAVAVIVYLAVINRKMKGAVTTTSELATKIGNRPAVATQSASSVEVAGSATTMTMEDETYL